MISPQEFLDCLSRLGINFFAGVPDSLLQELCLAITDRIEGNSHIICANEGNAVAMAAGHYLATGNPGAVYMQNSGLGNALNPLLSLADKEVYGIPMLLIIGWRGEPEKPDEPQHIKQGRVQNSLLVAAEIPYRIIDSSTTDAAEIVENLMKLSVEKHNPVALIVRKGAFAQYPKPKATPNPEALLGREEALEVILDAISTAIVVSTTGKTSREVFELRGKKGQPCRDFLTVGSMGHSSSLAAAIAMAKPKRRVVCLDGDGAMLMHLGALAVIGNHKPANLIHILLNNHCHESVGGQPTPSQQIDFSLLSKSLGYLHYYLAGEINSLQEALVNCRTAKGPVLLEVIIKPGSRKDLGRPTKSPAENKHLFMDFCTEE